MGGKRGCHLCLYHLFFPIVLKVIYEILSRGVVVGPLHKTLLVFKAQSFKLYLSLLFPIHSIMNSTTSSKDSTKPVMEATKPIMNSAKSTTGPMKPALTLETIKAWYPPKCKPSLKHTVRVRSTFSSHTPPYH